MSKNNNIAFNISKSFVNKFYELVKSFTNDDKSFNETKKKSEQYQDLYYFEVLKNDEFKKFVVNSAKDAYAQTSLQIIKLLEQAENIYQNCFENKATNVKEAIKYVNLYQKDLESVITNFELFDILPIYNFSENLKFELDVLKTKQKNEEYVDEQAFNNKIKDIFSKLKNTLILLKEAEIVENFFELYCESLKKQFTYYVENKSSKAHTLPNWAKGLLFLSPWILGFLIFTLYPIIETLIFSFSKVSLTTHGFDWEWIGWTNYKNLTQDTQFVLALKDYFINMLIYVPLITVFSLIIALLLNSNVKGIGVFRTIFFFPVIITSGPVMKILIEQGVTSMPGLNTVINTAEISAKLPPFIASMFNVLTSEFIMILWFSGIQILVFLTGLQKIDKSVYEASSIDGANSWEQFWKVTLPAINSSIVINVVFTVVMQSIFALNPIILKIQNDMNDTSLEKGYGFSSALSFIYFLVIIITLAVFVLIFKSHKKKVRKS